MAEHAPETPRQHETELPFRPRSDHNQRTSEPRPWTDLVSRDGAERIAAAIRSRTTAEVRFDDQSRALYSTDASNYRQIPIGVVVPRTIDDVVATIAVCREHRVPFLSRGGGTSLCGQCCNAAVVVDFSKHLDDVLEIDFGRRRARVEPGCVLDILRQAAEAHHLTFGPDPSTHDHNTLGGMIGNNSCGVHSVMAGRTADNVESLDILTYRRAAPDRWRNATERLSRRSCAQAAGGPRSIVVLPTLRDRYADLIRARLPAHPAPRLRLQP